MCGLVGVAGTIEEKERQVFHNLLYMDALRGEDGTGVASVERITPQDTFVVKVSGGPTVLYDRKAYWRAIDLLPNKCLLLGHNRYKTRGDGAFYNAHPFEFDDIVGAHNGVISDWTLSRMRPKLDGAIYDTDSESLFHFLDGEGIEETIKHLDTPVWDKYALTWYSKKNRTINILRNKERPLYYVFNKKRTTLFWASEIAMLYAALNRAKVDFAGKDVTFLAEDVHLSWTIPLKANEVFGKVVRATRKPAGFFRQQAKSTETLPGTREEWKQRAIQRQRIFLHGGSATSVSSSTCATDACGPHNVVELRPNLNTASSGAGKVTPQTVLGPSEYARNPDVKPGQLVTLKDLGMNYMVKPKGKDPAYYVHQGHFIKEDEFEEIVSSGCLNCTANPAFGEPLKLLRDKSFVCAPCLIDNKDGVRETIRSLM